MMNDRPLGMIEMEQASRVSVIIPVFNCERYLADAIESVLVQTYQSVEIIVVDDGSTDGSAEVAKRFVPPVHYCFQPNSGVGSARNRGIELARGDLFAFLDSDDLWTREKLKSQMAVFDADPSLDIVLGHMHHFFSPELDEETKRRLHCPADAAPGYLAGTMVVRREAFFRAGLFETNWRVGEFVAWYSKAMEEGLKSWMLAEVMLRRRIHMGNQVLRERQSKVDYVRIIKASLDRRRQKSFNGIEAQDFMKDPKSKEKDG